MDPKYRLTQIVLTAVLAGLLLLSSIISIFVPIFRITTPDYAPNYSATLPAFSTMIDGAKALFTSDSDTEIEKQFVANGGKELLEEESKDKTHKYHRASPTSGQVMKEIAFKRGYSPSAAERADFFVGYLDIARQNAENIYTDMASRLPDEAIEEKRLLREALDKKVLTVGAVAEAYREEVERFNFLGLHLFISACSASSDLTQESVAALEAEYLIGNYGLEVIQPLLANDLDDIGQTMPAYTDSFSLNGGRSIGIYCVISYNVGSVCGIFSILIVILAVGQIFLAIPVALDLVRLIKNQPRVEKPRKRKENFITRFLRKTHSYCAPLIAITMIFVPIAINVTREGYIAASGVSFGLVFAIALNLLAVVAEIVLAQYRKKHPLQ